LMEICEMCLMQSEVVFGSWSGDRKGIQPVKHPFSAVPVPQRFSSGDVLVTWPNLE